MKRRGAVFILTLVAMVAMVTLLTLAVNQNRVNLTKMRDRMESDRARLAAEAGVAYAMALLENQSKTLTQQSDDWFTTGRSGADSFTFPGGSFRLQIVDSCSYIDLNTAPQAQLQNLPLTGEQMDALLDYRESSTTPRSDGAKDDFYHNLTNPYNTRLHPFSTFDELLQVRYFTPQTLYTVQTTTTSSNANVPTDLALYELCQVDTLASANGKTNINTATQAQLTRAGIPANVALNIIRQRPVTGYTSLGPVLAQARLSVQQSLAFLDSFTIGTTGYRKGQVNVNTASQDVLQTLPGFTSQIASTIVQRQSSGITNLASLSDVQGLTTAIIQQCADLLTVASEGFIVRVVGTAGGVTKTLEGWVRIDGSHPVMYRLETPPFSDMPTRWSWADVDNTIDLGDLQQ
ncbi:MAG: helix-hairpin-helix domain-containing protein [Armatimonadetes bacterium]|nr:helix-hairpin-helix domain-containing protein [Armatimonadota bacterium]